MIKRTHITTRRPRGLDYDETRGILILQIPFLHRHIPRSRGFRWNQRMNAWYTTEILTEARRARLDALLPTRQTQ